MEITYFDVNKFLEVMDEAIDNVARVEKKRKGNYNQAGANNNNYKNGISTYTQHKHSSCQKCGSTKNLMVHHKDGNRKNNKPSNLITLCWSCHEKITVRKGIADYLFSIKPEDAYWGVGAFILNDKNETVIGQRSDNKLWASPGGKVDPGEMPIESLSREIEEETGITDISPVFVGAAFTENEGIIWLSFVFVCYTSQNELTPQPGEFDSLKWDHIDNVMEYDLFGPTKSSYHYILENYPSLFDISDYLDIESPKEIDYTAVEKMTSVEQLVDVKNPGRNGGNGVIGPAGWTYKKPGTNRAAPAKQITSQPRKVSQQIQVLKDSYVEYFKGKESIDIIYKVEDGNFVFPEYQNALDQGIVKDKKNYLKLFKEQYVHFALNHKK